MQSRHVAMSWEEFERLPRSLGWKYEYFGGKAHITPHSAAAYVSVPIQPRAASAACSIRPVMPEDRTGLIAAFHASFCATVEYCDWPDAKIRKSAQDSIEGFYSGRRGDPMTASRAAFVPAEETSEPSLIGAALLIRNREGPFLDMLFIHPRWQRQGVATAMLASAMSQLAEEGERRLGSSYHLANDPSIAWHQRFGFTEEPDLFLVQRRLHIQRHRIWQQEQQGEASAETLAQLHAERDRLQAEQARLEAIAKREGMEAVAPVLRRP